MLKPKTQLPWKITSKIILPLPQKFRTIKSLKYRKNSKRCLLSSQCRIKERRRSRLLLKAKRYCTMRIKESCRRKAWRMSFKVKRVWKKIKVRKTISPLFPQVLIHLALKVHLVRARKAIKWQVIILKQYKNMKRLENSKSPHQNQVANKNKENFHLQKK